MAALRRFLGGNLDLPLMGMETDMQTVRQESSSLQIEWLLQKSIGRPILELGPRKQAGSLHDFVNAFLPHDGHEMKAMHRRSLQKPIGAAANLR